MRSCSTLVVGTSPSSFVCEVGDGLSTLLRKVAVPVLHRRVVPSLRGLGADAFHPQASPRLRRCTVLFPRGVAKGIDRSFPKNSALVGRIRRRYNSDRSLSV